MKLAPLVALALATIPLTSVATHAQDLVWQAEIGSDFFYAGTNPTWVHTHSALDSNGDLIIIGGAQLPSSTQRYLWVEKLAPNGTSLWFIDWVAPSGATLNPTGVVVDNSGEVYVQTSIGGGTAAVVLKILGASGTIAWTDTFTQPGPVPMSVRHFTIDSLGRPVSSVEYLDSDERVQIRIRVLTASGQVAWMGAESGRYRGSKMLRGGPCAAGSQGVVTCVNSGIHTNLKPNQVGQADIAVTRYSASGRVQWKKTFDDRTLPNRPTAVAVNAQGDIIVLGYTELGNHSGAPPFEVIAMRVRGSNGQKTWSQRVPNTVASPTGGLLPTSQGDFIAVVLDYPTPGDFGVRLLRIDSATGSIKWSRRHPGGLAAYAATPDGDPVMLYFTNSTATHDLMRHVDRDTGAAVSELQMSIGWTSSLAIDRDSGRRFAVGNLSEVIDNGSVSRFECAAYD